jgi:hypothetical protein
LTGVTLPVTNSSVASEPGLRAREDGELPWVLARWRAVMAGLLTAVPGSLLKPVSVAVDATVSSCDCGCGGHKYSSVILRERIQ